MQNLLPRRWLVATVLLVAVVGAGYLVVPVSRISQATCDKIQIGWTLPQVEETVGEDLKTEPLEWSNPVVTWSNAWGDTIEVTFDAWRFRISQEADGIHVDPGRVTYKAFIPSKLPLWKQVKLFLECRIRSLWR